MHGSTDIYIRRPTWLFANAECNLECVQENDKTIGLNKTGSPAVAEQEPIVRRCHGVAVQHADDGYFGRGNFGGLLVHGMI